MKSVLITGCSAGGIGPALAHAFHQKGYHVFATARTPSKIPSTLSGASNVTVLKLDVLSPDSIAAAVESVSKQTGGKLDVLVNNSGGNNTILPALDVDIAEAKAEFDLNFWAPLAMMRAFAPLLIEARGCLVNNTSASALSPFPLMSSVSPFQHLLSMFCVVTNPSHIKRHLQRLQSSPRQRERDLAPRAAAPGRAHHHPHHHGRQDGRL
jgi:NAD(P)-dependent dehydrogenase (short-subunit alcohol dehydrogenase family)